MARDFKRAAQAAAWLCMAVFGWLMGIGMAMAATTPSQFPIVDYQLVSKTAVAGSPTGQYDYVYRLQVRNAGTDVAGAQGAATSRRSSVIATDAEVSFPAIKARQLALSSDTFSLRAGQFFDRRLDPKSRRNGRMAYDVPGTDPDDAQAGFAPLNLELGDVAINTWFVTKLNAVLEWRLQVVTDVTAPVISATLPLGNVASSRPVISASYADAGGAINTASVVLTLDGQPVSGAEVSATGIRYTPTTDLAQGAHAVVLKVRDAAGNEASANWNFTVLTSGPALTLTTPAEGEVLPADALPTLSGQWAVPPAGIDPASLSVRLDGQPVTAQISGNGFSATIAAALTEGPHSWTVSVRDTLGNAASRSGNFVTRSVPVISDMAPMDAFLASGAKPVIGAALFDIGSGVDVARVRLWLDGDEVTARAAISATRVALTLTQPLADGEHKVKLVIADRAGNESQAEWGFGIAQPPQITSVGPQDVLLPTGSKPRIFATFQDSRVGIEPSGVRLLVNGDDVSGQAQITATGISYTPAAALPAGPQSVYLEVSNKLNGATSAAWSFDVDTPSAYDLKILTPAGPQSVIEPRLEVTAQAYGSRSEVVRMTLSGREMSLRASAPNQEGLIYAGDIDLVDGVNTLEVVATFADGTTRSATVQVTHDAPVKVVITSPADKAMLGRASNTSPGDLTGSVERPVAVTGRLSKPARSVSVNQQAAQVAADGLSFNFPNFFLREGTNMITVVAVDQMGRVGSAAITVSVDQTAPILNLESPRDGTITSSTSIDLRGMVNDAVEGLAGAPEPVVRVQVNGRDANGGKPAQVADRYFLVPNVPLELGENRINVSAVDQFGNARAQEIRISRIAAGSERLTMVEGHLQRGAVGAELSKPLAVVLLNERGEPIGDAPVRFDVQRGTGTISLKPGAGTSTDGVTRARNLEVRTDAFGRAAVWFTLGKQSGPGANVVQVSRTGVNEPVTFSATSDRGVIAKVNADMGTNQLAQTGAQPLDLMTVVVRDDHDNPLPGVAVVYTVEEGDAYFADTLGGIASEQGRRMTMTTDKNGLVAVRPWLGNTPSSVRISAKAMKDADAGVNTEGNLVGNAVFMVKSKVGVDGPATFRGHVYTDRGQPLAGVRVSVGRTSLSSTTDESGAFELTQVPAGRIDLFVDGRTVNPTNDPARSQWPSLHFEAFVVNGQDNALPHPIYLPPLLTSEAKVVGGNQDVILKMPGLEGFQMRVKANSVTFPDGSHVGTLVVSPVTADKLPMAPPAGGATFGVPAWTIQPAGTRFDPPIEVTLPNARSQPPGDNLPIVQWDHDLGQYVPMGRATVSEDGSVLVTDVGSGITKAGWGGLCQYDPDKCATSSCKFCEKKNDSGSEPCCVFDDAKDQKVQYISNVALSTEPFKGILDKLTKVAGAAGEFKVKFDGAVVGRAEEMCCSLKKRSSKRVSLSGQMKLEGEGKLNLIQALERVQRFLPRGLEDATDAGVYLMLRGGGNFSGALSYDGCKSKPGPDSVTGSVYLNAAISARIKWPAIKAGGVQVFPDAELNLGEVGITGGAKLLQLKMTSEGVAQSPVEGFLYSYFKGDLRVGTMKITNWDFQFPLIDSATTQLHAPVADF